MMVYALKGLLGKLFVGGLEREGGRQGEKEHWARGDATLREKGRMKWRV